MYQITQTLGLTSHLQVSFKTSTSRFFVLLHCWESLCDIRPDRSHHTLVMNGTLNAMLNGFAKAEKVADESIGR